MLKGIETLSFNSLQTGNCIQTEKKGDHKKLGVLFQFPSNGKLHSNLDKERKEKKTKCFNSLQTGNCIQTDYIRV